MYIVMKRYLWIAYREAGTGELKTTLQMNRIKLKLWSNDISSIIEQYKIQGENKDSVCFFLVNYCIRQLNNKIIQFKRELSTLCPNTIRPVEYTSDMGNIIKEFVLEELNYLRNKIDSQIAQIKYHYIDEILQQQYLAQNPTNIQIQWFERLSQVKYEYERTRNEVNFLKKIHPISPSKPTLNCQSIAQSPFIKSIQISTVEKEQINKQYKIFIEQTKANMMNIYRKFIQEQMLHYEKQFNILMKEINQMNNSLPQDQQLTSAMLNLIDHRFINITIHIESIYKLHTAQFHTKFNID